MIFDAFVVSCEHASHAVPVRWRQPFAATPEVLHTHRAWDPGALTLARYFARALKAPLFCGQVTRLLVDLNRRANTRAVFSEFSRRLPPQQRQHLLHLYHWPYRVLVQHAVAELLAAGRKVLHLSCHSFTPVLDGKTRQTEIGLLFDPKRPGENSLCRNWQQALATALPKHRTRLNDPYRGTSDGVTTWLRGLFAPDQYAGIELELNQAFAASPADRWLSVRHGLLRTLHSSLRG